MKRIYGPMVNCRLISDFLSCACDRRSAKKKGDIDKNLEKRIMLAVTHVNGCKLCSWFHTRDALKIGMPDAEIKELLDGDVSAVPEDEAVAIAFAQHYADTLGHVDSAAWRRVVWTYGREKALGVRACICMIMAGNAQGNAWGALASRLKGRPEPGSSFGKEAGVIVCDLFVVPFMLIWALFRGFMRRLVPTPAYR